MKYSITNDTITVVIKGHVHTVHDDMLVFNDLRKALINEHWLAVEDLVTPAAAINSWSHGEFRVVDGVIKYKEDTLPETLNARILAMVKEKRDPAALTNFWEKLQKNPSNRSVQQLYTFLVHEAIPITPSGNFLAYKSVRQDFTDHHTGEVLNKPGTVNELPRNKISDDPDLACDFGFHVGALKYANNFSSNGRLMVCEVDPADVVCVPKDHNAQKVRVCKYRVLGEYKGDLSSTVATRAEAVTIVPSFEDDYVPSLDDDDDYDDDYEDDDYEDDHYEDVTQILSKQIALETDREILIGCLREANGDYEDEDENEKEDYNNIPLPSRATRKRAATRKQDSDNLDDLDYLSNSDLRYVNMDKLRRYASRKLGIAGAYRIPGGKNALLQAIYNVRC